jgi:hypothetical protein
MLGDGYFFSAMAIYTVGPRRARAPAPPAVATGSAPLAPGVGVCNGCTIVYQTVAPEPVVELTVEQQTIVEPVIIAPSICDPFLGDCHVRRRERERPRFKTAGICRIGIDCPPGQGRAAKAILVPQRASLTMSPIGRPAPEPPPMRVTTTVVSGPVYRVVAPGGAPVPANPGVAPGVRAATAPVVRVGGSRFAMGSGGSRAANPPAATPPAAAAPRGRTMALPRAIFRKP